jgi:DinB superfamily
MDIDWNAELVGQLDGHWQHQLRARLDGLTDEEYFWEPVAGCWNVRPRTERTPADAPGSGDYTVDFTFPPPQPPPVTTIAWRLAHIIVGCFDMRNAAHFGGPRADYQTFGYAGTAAQALGQLDHAYAAWIAGVRGLGADGLSRPCGPAEGPFADCSMATLVLHIHREVIHHGAEISLLRDFYLHQD